MLLYVYLCGRSIEPVSYTHLDVYKRQAQTLQLTMREQRVGYFILNGKQYQILSELDRENRSKPSDLQNIYVVLLRSSQLGRAVPQ